MMRTDKITLLLSLLCSLFMISCEDEIDLDLEERPNQLVVDAFLTNDSSIQTVRLTKSAPYFLNEPTKGAKGAIVKVIGPSSSYTFTDQGDGNYTYDPATNGPIDSTGFKYSLEIIYDGATYTSSSVLNPVPQIDTIITVFEEEELGQEAGYYAQFFATDFAGRKDYYWIRAFKNGIDVRPDQPSSLILAEDGAFGGEGADGFVFILPLRAAITNNEEPFAAGDICKVELLSLNGDAFEFLDQVTIQANNGGLFSTPPANIKSNIRDAAGNLQEEVLGVFSLSSISIESIQVQP